MFCNIIKQNVNTGVCGMIKLNREKFFEEINAKWINKNCPMCGKNHWNIDTSVVTPLKVNENSGISIGGSIFPIVPITCSNCGNVVFVNPLVIGALDHDEEETSNG